MPNIVNRLTVDLFTKQVEEMGSCVVVAFNKLTVQQAQELRNRFRDEDVNLMVCKNRLAKIALGAHGHEIPRLQGKCGVAFAPEEKAITAAKLVRDFAKENKGLEIGILAGVIEGEVITGDDAKAIADMPDKDTVRSMIASAISAPARGLATALNAVGGGLARCLQQRADGEGGGD